MKRAISRKNLWELTPHWIKSSVGRPLALMPLSWIMGRNYRKSRRLLREAQWWSAEQSREYQLVKLRGLCNLAYSKSPYYRRTFDAVGFEPGDLKTLDDFAALPTIDRHTVREHADEMCTQAPHGPGVDLCETGGTGGSPLTYYMDCRRSAVEYAYLVASWERAGYWPGMPMAVMRGHNIKPRRDGFYYEFDPVFRHHSYSSYHMTDANMRRYLEHVSTLGPCFLHVYPSSAATLSRFVQRSGIAPPKNVLGIIAESENIYPGQRTDIEETLKVRMFSCYGHSEKLVLAAECEDSTDYHVWPTYGYFELLDEESQPVLSVGQRGEIVGTGFVSMVMPFIRYRTGDYATYAGSRCQACGREHVMLREVRGHRTQEVLIAADGTAMPWTGLSVEGQRDAFRHVRQLQFYQDTPGRAVLKIVPAEGFGNRSRRAIRKFFEWKCEGAIDFTIELADSIPLSPRGKAIYVDQRIELDKPDSMAEKAAALPLVVGLGLSLCAKLLSMLHCGAADLMSALQS
jgi:phenylacetate-CoA ligase